MPRAVLPAIVLGTLMAIAYAALTPRPGRMGADDVLAALAWTLLDLATLAVAFGDLAVDARQACARLKNPRRPICPYRALPKPART